MFGGPNSQRGSIFVSGLGPGSRIRYRIWTGGPNLRGGPNPLGHREITFELTLAAVKAFLSDIISLMNHIKKIPKNKMK